MDNELLRKVQLTQLEIYKQVCEIANRNHITVYLCAGSLLGAVRHKGFIPWDDDLDIMVPRKDYEKLMSALAAELPEQYWLQNYDTDEQYWQPFAKVRKKGTLYKERALQKIDDSKCGIWLDIFPLDNAKKATGVKLKMRKFIVRTIVFSVRKRELGLPFATFSRRYVPVLLLWNLFPKKCLKKIQCYVMKNVDVGETKFFVNLASNYRLEKATYPAEWFAETVSIAYEDTVCNAPVQYKLYLEKLYGDYMALPPVEKRCGHNMDDQFPVVV